MHMLGCMYTFSVLRFLFLPHTFSCASVLVCSVHMCLCSVSSVSVCPVRFYFLHKCFSRPDNTQSFVSMMLADCPMAPIRVHQIMNGAVRIRNDDRPCLLLQVVDLCYEWAFVLIADGTFPIWPLQSQIICWLSETQLKFWTSLVSMLCRVYLWWCVFVMCCGVYCCTVLHCWYSVSIKYQV